MQASRTVEVLGNLPGHNCGGCGCARCEQFADMLISGEADLSACATLEQERYRQNKERLETILRGCPGTCAEHISRNTPQPGALEERPYGVLDGYEADFILAPLPDESACRELLFPLTPGDISTSDVIRYRPLGCPITHFARILEEKDGLLEVHVIGPRHRLGDETFQFLDIGLCMVIGFVGAVRGSMPSVGETVRFLPDECMMQKVHSGVVVNAEGRTVRIEGLDLKVWAPPVKVDSQRRRR